MSALPRYAWPPPVQPGEVVVAAAPASPVARAACQSGVNILQEWGFQVRCGPEVFHKRSWEETADRQIARRFLDFWAAPEVKAVLGVRGGYGSLKILSHLDFDALKTRRKILLGFSDLTNLLWSFHRLLKLVTFHGPNVAQLADLTPGARESFFKWLTIQGPRQVVFPGLTTLNPGRARGFLAGGNLTTLCHLLGTPFAPKFSGCILFLEDHNEPLYRLDRMLHHLLLAGALKGVKGVALGAFTATGPQESFLEMAAAALAPLKVPVLAGLPVGHQPDNHVLPLGAWAYLDGAAGELALVG